MRYRLIVLRQQGERLNAPLVLGSDVQLGSNQVGSFFVLQARRSFSASDECLAKLFEPKLVAAGVTRLHFLGFEQEGSASHVQEWILEQFRTGFGREVNAQSAHSRFEPGRAD